MEEQENDTSHVVLPPEVWWLICQELAQGGAVPEFDALFNLALVSRDMALWALPQLYSVHNQASASASDASLSGERKWVILWRSLILSTIGKTAFPYALWIRQLELGNLMSLLEEIGSRDREGLREGLRAAFWAGDMAVFQIQQTKGGKPASTVATRQSKRRQPPLLDRQAICLKVGDHMTTFVSDAAEREGKTVALTSLEGHHIPADRLLEWIKRLSTLRSLSVRDGSVLTEEVGVAIRDSCPAFVELSCYFCQGDSVDEDLAGFFQALRPGSLESFALFSSFNRLGQKSFAALSQCHASSLKTLDLSGLNRGNVENLDALAPCTALETLHLENSRSEQFAWRDSHKDAFQRTVHWLQSCETLTTLTVELLPDTHVLLADVLPCKSLRLRHLTIGIPENGSKQPLCEVIGEQSALRTLRISSDNFDWVDDHRLVHRIAQSCEQLVELHLTDTNFEANDLKMMKWLPALEKLSFSGHRLGDDVWDCLSALPRLTAVQINGTSEFTSDGINGFIDKLARDGGKDGGKATHWGFSLQINYQGGYMKLSTKEEDDILKAVQQKLGGEFSIGYDRDPDEDHESDFSDD